MNKKSSDKEYVVLMNRSRILRTTERIAYQIDEDLQGKQEMLIVGIGKGGTAVANCLAEILGELTSSVIRQIQLPENPGESGKIEMTAELPNQFNYGLIVDDVIFSGRTVLNSVEAVRQMFDVKVLRTAVLVDRGHRTVPVEASFTGINLPTKLDEHVQVHVDEDSVEKVVLIKNSD